MTATLTRLGALLVVFQFCAAATSSAQPAATLGADRTTTLNTMMAAEGDARPREPRDGFAAAVALYPSCESRMGVYRPLAPLLILTGDKDDWTPAEPCRELAKASRAAGHPVTLKVYPGAHHSFDSPRPERYVAAPEAWADSIREVTAFFERHLGRAQ